MNNQGCVIMEFDSDTGIRHLNDMDELFIPNEILGTAKKTLLEEINMKMHIYKVNRNHLWLFALGIVFFILGGVTVIFIFPFNFIFTVLGIIFFISPPIYFYKKAAQQKKILRYASDLVECRTHGIIRIQYNYGISLIVGRRSVRNRKTLTSVSARIIPSKLALYNNRNQNNYNNMNPVMDQMNPPMYPGEPIHPPYQQPPQNYNNFNQTGNTQRPNDVYYNTNLI